MIQRFNELLFAFRSTCGLLAPEGFQSFDCDECYLRNALCRPCTILVLKPWGLNQA
jgi:hypothetical protein